MLSVCIPIGGKTNYIQLRLWRQKGFACVFYKRYVQEILEKILLYQFLLLHFKKLAIFSCYSFQEDIWNFSALDI